MASLTIPTISSSPCNSLVSLLSHSLNFAAHHPYLHLKQPKNRSLSTHCNKRNINGEVPLGSINGSSSKKENSDSPEYEDVLKGGEQVVSVLQEMVTLLEDMNMDDASEEVAVQLAAQGVIGKRVDEMESGFMMALDYMIKTAEKDQDEKRKTLLEVVKETVLSHLTKKCPPHVQVIGLLCRTPQKESRQELLRRVAAGGGAFQSENGTKVHLPGANLNDIANQADDLLEIILLQIRCPSMCLNNMWNGALQSSLTGLSKFRHDSTWSQYCDTILSPDCFLYYINLLWSIAMVYLTFTSINFVLQTMECRTEVPDRKLLARLVLIREEARNMMGGGLLDERNDRGFNTLPESEVNFLTKLVALKPGKTVREMIKNVMQGKDEGAADYGTVKNSSRGIAGRASVSGRDPLPVRPGMFLETVSKVLGGIYAGNTSGVTAQHLEWVHQNTLQVLEEIAF